VVGGKELLKGKQKLPKAKPAGGFGGLDGKHIPQW
jgi:hypothetical protein